MIPSENKKIAVSVIIPAYNVETYIGECIESLVAQTLDNIEILIVNDGSTDKTQEIIEHYCEAYPEKIRAFSQENAGPSKARNFALSIATGDYISFIDSDDQASPEMLMKLYNCAIAHNADLVVCGRAYRSEDGNVTSIWFPKEIDRTTNIFQSPQLLSDTSSFLWDKLFRRETLERFNFTFDENIHYAEDALFVYRFLYYASNVCSVQEALYYYTVRRSGSITGAMDARILHEIEACRELTKFYIQVGSFTIFRRNLMWICIGFWGRKFYSFCEHPGKKKVRYEFVCKFYNFLEEFYPEWKIGICQYATKGNKRRQLINRYKTNKMLVWFYIYTPGGLIRAVRKLRQFPNDSVRFLKSVKRKIFAKKMEQNFENYLKARSMMPIDDKSLLFISNSGDNLAGNPFYLALDAAARKEYKIYMGSKNPQKDKLVVQKLGVDIILLKMGSPQFQLVLATAKFLITNYRFPTYFCKREGQVIMNTWHGTPLKSLGKHMNNGLRDLGNVQSQFLACDYLLYPNMYTKAKMFDAFQLNELFQQKALVSGYPCNSIFFDRTYEKQLRAALGLQGKKVVVYMPTWRGQSTAAMDRSYQATMKEILSDIDEQIDNETVLFVKMHNLASRAIGLTGYKHIRPFPDNLEIYYFLNIADILITDYSSVLFDFANTRKEIILFSYDEEEYVTERGMYMGLSEIPFKRVHTVRDLTACIRDWHGNISISPTAYDEFCMRFCSLDSAQTVEIVNDIILGTKSIPTSPCKKKFTVCFAPELSNAQIINTCLELMRSEKHLLFAFSMNSITPYMDQLLKSPDFLTLNYIIVQNEDVLTRREIRAISNGEKSKKWNKMARDALAREENRMFPGISIKKAINLTEDSFFGSLTAFLNEIVNNKQD